MTVELISFAIIIVLVCIVVPVLEGREFGHNVAAVWAEAV